MAATLWGGVGWIVIAVFALLLLPPLGALTLRRLPRIAQDTDGETGPLSAVRRL